MNTSVTTPGRFIPFSRGRPGGREATPWSAPRPGDTFKVQALPSGAASLHLLGTGGPNRLISPDEDITYWQITGPDQGDLGNLYRQPGAVTFTGIGTLIGSAGGSGFLGRDWFFFSPEFDPASSAAASLSGVIDAGGTGKTLDYSSPLFTIGVVVDLSGQNTPTNSVGGKLLPAFLRVGKLSHWNSS